MRLNVWGIGLATLALFFGGCLGAQGHEGVSSMTIYYFPIDAETLTPITSANIQERGKRCEIHSAKEIEKIRVVLRAASSPASQTFSDRRVRMKISETSNSGAGLSAVVEKEGEVRFSDGKEAVLSRKGLEIIKKIVETECKP
jgi:hypothetical protein